MPRVDLIGPDGAAYDVEASEIDQALKLPGFKLANPTSKTESAVRGAVQGATLGTSDEMRGWVGALASAAQVPWDRTPGPAALAKLYPGVPYPDAAAQWFAENRPDVASAAAADKGRQDAPAAYLAARDAERAKNAAAKAANPKAYGASEAGGTFLTTAPLTAFGGPLAQAIGAAGTGAIQGAGYSDADTLRGTLGDAAGGAALGLASFGVGKALAKGAQALRANASSALALARGRAAEEAAKKPLQILRGEISSLGGESAAMNNDIKWVRILLQEEQNGTITPGNQALLKSLTQRPEWAATLNKAAETVAEELPSRAAKVAEKQAIVSGLQSALPEQIAQGTAERVAPGATFKRTWGIAKRELSPVAGAVIGGELADDLGLHDSAAGKVGGALLGGAAGAMYGRGRLGKALTDLRKMPSSQILLNQIKMGAANVPAALGRYVPVLRAAAARGSDALAAAHFLLYNNDEGYRTGLDGLEQAKREADR